MLLCLDLLCIGLHLTTMEFLASGGTTLWGSFHPDPWLRIDRDRSASEWYEAAKMIVAATLLLRVSRKDFGNSFSALALIALYMTADNLLRIHERMGRLLGGPGPERHSMEFAYMAAVGVVIIAVVVVCAVRGAKEIRPAIFGLGFAILMLGGAAAVLDATHMLLGGYGKLFNTAFTLMEDGGELIAQSVFLGCALQAFRAHMFVTSGVPNLVRT